MRAHFTAGDAGEITDLGVARMRLLLTRGQIDGRVAAAEFHGEAGPWTLPHVHRNLDELFYVVDGSFTFTCGEEEYAAQPGSLVTIPRGTTHVFEAVSDGTVLVLWVPGGLEEMFLELGRLPADSLTDPAARLEISARHDSIPSRAP